MGPIRPRLGRSREPDGEECRRLRYHRGMALFSLDVLGHPLFTFVGTLATVGAFAVALLRWPRKKLWWEVVQLFPIVDVRSDPEATIELAGGTWRAAEVDEVVIEVINSGNREIVPEDYTRPLTFDFGGEAKVLVSEILYEEPARIGASVEKGSNTATLTPVLLNGGDRVGLRMLVSKARRIRWDGRIKGVKKIEVGSGQLRLASLGLLGSITSILMGPAIVFPELLPPSLLGVASALLLVGIVLAGLGVVLSSRETRRQRRRSRHVSHLESTLAASALVEEQPPRWRRLLGR
jgi:hypothetical protein